jgi:hypothetical protein
VKPIAYAALAAFAAFAIYELWPSAPTLVGAVQNPLQGPTPTGNAPASSQITQTQTGAGLFDDAAGLGNNPTPMPTSNLGNTLQTLQSGGMSAFEELA